MNKRWEKTDALMKARSIRAMNVKIVISDGKYNHDLYVKLGWANRRWVWVDITVSRFNSVKSENESADEVELRRQLFDTNKRLIEIVCLHATELLQSGERGIVDIVKSWKGTKFSPSGTCESIRNEINEGVVTSPLDAAAKLIEFRMKEWSRMYRKEERADDEYLEGLVSDCLEKVEDDSEGFTEWELNFLKSIADKHDYRHLSEKEIDKLEEIHEEKCFA